MNSIAPATWRRLLLACLLVALTVISVTPIRSYDFFWHLATGRWIAEHGALPGTDPFSLSSDPVSWVDGEWLFQLGAFAIYAAGGIAAVSVAHAVVVAAIFTFAFAETSRRSAPTVALAVTMVALYGADHRMTARPESLATLLLVASLVLLGREVTGRVALAFALVVVVWINVHPSALLAPVFAVLAAAGAALTAKESPAGIAKRFGLVAVGGLALLANPNFVDGVVAPLRLARLASSGEFVNMEWTASRLADFPLLYFVVPAALVLFALDPGRRERLTSVAIFAFLGALALRYVRNQGFFFAALPLLVAPSLPKLETVRMKAIGGAIVVLVAASLLVRHDGIATGVDRTQFPVASVAYLESLGLRGNIYNPDQLGGYLIWRFYPERRVLTDGRNELHRTFIEEYAKARLDERAWRAMITKYDLALAVDEYHRETMDVIDATTGRVTHRPASLIYFPRNRWALIGFDDVGIVFARRDAFDPSLIAKLEFKTLVPDGAVPLVDTSPGTLALARLEIRRARATFGRQNAIERIARGLGE